MPKLLIISTTAATLRAFLLPYARHFRALGWRVDAIAAGAESDPVCCEAFDQVQDIQWSRNPLDPRNLILAPRIIKAAFRRESYDLVHVHTPVAAFVTRYALHGFRKQGKCKVIYTAHGFHFHPAGNKIKNGVYRRLEKIAGPWTDYLITINGEDEAAAKTHRLLPPEKIRYMPGIGVDLDFYDSQAISENDIAKVRGELRLGEKDRFLLCVAELIPRKRQADLLQAFAALPRPEVHLVLAGPDAGPYANQLRRLSKELHIDERVHFLGMRSDIPALMRASTLNILVSEQEGLPRSVLESLSLEVPTIGTSIRGTRELLENGSGILVEIGNVPAMTEAMKWVLDNPAEARSMAQRGKLKVQDYDLGRIISLHEELYDEALRSMGSLDQRRNTSSPFPEPSQSVIARIL